MSALASALTVEQFLAMPEDETVRRELIGGEILEMARAGKKHEVTKSNFAQKLGAYFEHSPIGRMMPETSYRLSPEDCPQPDVSVILGNRLDEIESGLIPFAPDIAIEVVSSESAATLQAKIKLYRRHGTKAVWVAYPELRIIHIYEAAGMRELSGDQQLEAPGILPGFSVAVSAFFEGL